MTPEELRTQVKTVETQLRKGARLTPEGRKALRKAKALLLEHDYGRGAVEARKCRASGALRVLYRPGTQMIEDDGWFLVCDTHSTCLSNDTRALAVLAMSDPDWCEECQELSAKGTRAPNVVGS